MVAALSITVATLLTLVGITAPIIAWRQTRLVEETRQQLYVKDVAIAYKLWDDGDLAQVREILDRYATGSRYADFRDFPWYYLDGLYQRATAGFMTGDWFDVSHSTNLLAVGRNDDLIHLYDLESWNEVGTLPWNQPALAAFRFSPDGRFLAAAHASGTLSVCEVATRRQLYKITIGSQMNGVYSPWFSPDGSILAIGGPEDVIKIFETTTGNLLHVLTGHDDDVSVVAFSPDGKTLATGSFDYSLRLWDTDTWKPRAVIDDAFHARVYALAYDPTGARLAAGGYGKEIRIWDPAGQPIASLPSSDAGTGSLCFSPDGRLLAAGGEMQGTVHVWNVEERKLVQEYLVGHAPAAVGFLPSGELLVASDGKLMRRVLGASADLARNRKDDIRSEEIAIDISAAGDLVVAGYGRYVADPGEGAVACLDLRRGKHWRTSRT